MTNLVDTSPEAIAQEWELLAKNSKVKLEPETVEDAEVISETPADEVKSEGGLFDNMDGVEVEAGPVPLPGDLTSPTVTEDEQIKMAKTIIAGGLSFLMKVGMNLEPSEFKGQIDDLAQSYAEVITKYYKGGIFEFLARFKEEIAAVGATIALIGAVSKARKLQQPDEKEINDEK